ncbi:MAG: hypothetical protein ACM31C_12365 [Acidobacteriota bacterium]
MGRGVVVGVLSLAGCFSQPPAPSRQASGDAGVDAAACVVTTSVCDGDTLRETCADGSALATTCDWGCMPGAAPRCLQLVAAGGAVTPADLDPAGLADVVVPDAVLDSDAGTIGGIRGAGTDVISGIGYTQVTSPVPAATFRFKSLHVTGQLHLQGTRALALVADGDIVIDGMLDGTYACGGAHPGPPGGSAGGMASAGLGTGGGAAGNGASQGGGGGGYGHVGGAGGVNSGTPPAGGITWGTPEIMLLVGGSGGGAGNGTSGGIGGAGGAAIQLVSNTSITISTTGIVNAGGCGGSAQPNAAPGGGGGAGGAILLEAPSVTVNGVLAVNGGGGAGGDVGGGAGKDGQPSYAPAAGGVAGGGGIGTGGAGGYGATAAQAGAGSSRSGGGGGAVGWIRIDTRPGTPAATATATMSPGLLDVGTTTTTGSATLN